MARRVPKAKQDAPETGEPIEGYDEMTVAEIVDEMDSMTPSEVQDVKDYEEQGSARKTVMSYETDAPSVNPESVDDGNGEDDIDPIVAEAIDTAAAVAAGPPTPLIVVDGRNRRLGADGLHGGFVNVIGGEYAGRVGAFVETLARDEDGYPTEILVQSRDADSILMDVDYADVENAGDYSGGR